MLAKKSNIEGDWRIFRQQRNLVNNLNKANKNNYYKSKLNITKKDDFYDISVEGSKNMWRTVKDLTGNCKQTPPHTISFDGELITSVKKICNLANEHYISLKNILKISPSNK